MEQTESNSLSSSLSIFSSFTPENESPTPRLSLSYLQQITEPDWCSGSNYLEVSLNVNEIAVDNLGELLPNLYMLKLTDGSIVYSLRSLGSSLHALRYLYAPQCSIEFIEGVGTMSQLQELYLPFNRISDLSPLAVLENLTLLDIECNKVSHRSQFTHLALCRSLTALYMHGNPICEELGVNYKQKILSLVPNVVNIDGADSQSLEVIQNEGNSRIDGGKLLITKSFSNQIVHFPSPPNVAPSQTRRAKTSLGTCQKPAPFKFNSDHVSDVQRSVNVISQRPKTASGDFSRRIGSRLFSDVLDNYSQDKSFEFQENASDLTQGLRSSLCGSLTHSLRAKKCKNKPSNAKLDLICEGIEKDSNYTVNNIPISKSARLESVLVDLKNWKLRFETNSDLISDVDAEIS